MRSFSALVAVALLYGRVSASLPCTAADPSAEECEEQESPSHLSPEEFSTSLLQTSIKFSDASPSSRTSSGAVEQGNRSMLDFSSCFTTDLSQIGVLWGHTFKTHFGEGVDYSQQWQASILHQTFFASDPITKGVVVELGAVDGLKGSNSYAFEEGLGWHAVLIEANPDLACQLRQNRPGADVHAPLAISSTSGPVNFSICDEQPDFSGLDSWGNLCDHNVTVQSEPLSSVLEGIDVVDILFLDVEGAELTVLESIDFTKTKIRVINVESGCPNSEVGNFLTSKCYQYRGNIFQDSVWTVCGFHPY